MKTKVFALFLLLVGLNSHANFLRVDYAITDFNYIDQVDLSIAPFEYFDETTGLKVYVFEMVNSEDKLITIKDETSNELRPVIFYQQFNQSLIYKDINNRKDVVVFETDGDSKLKSVNYIEENDSKEGLAIYADCLGGSTSKCIDIAWKACMGDTGCSITCVLTGPACPSAIIIACAGACNL